jgi:hypothetical protein
MDLFLKFSIVFYILVSWTSVNLFRIWQSKSSKVRLRWC